MAIRRQVRLLRLELPKPPRIRRRKTGPLISPFKTNNKSMYKPSVHSIIAAVFFSLGGLALHAASSDPDFYSVLDFGAKGDGQPNDTGAFQKGPDAASQSGGGVVYAPRGNYFFAGHLDVPRAVTLKGVWESVPAHNGLRDRGGSKPTDDGTTFLVTEGEGSEDGTPFINLHDNSTLKGVVLYYPNQNPDA